MIEQRSFRPAAGVFMAILGARREETVHALIDALEQQPDLRDSSFYRPVLFEVIFAGRYDFCRSADYRRLEALLSPTEREELLTFCASSLGRPPDAGDRLTLVVAGPSAARSNLIGAARNCGINLVRELNEGGEGLVYLEGLSVDPAEDRPTACVTQWLHDNSGSGLRLVNRGV
jgi:hypothetical protein